MIFHGLDDKGAPTLLIISLLSYSVEWTNSDMFFIAAKTSDMRPRGTATVQSYSDL